MTEIVMRKHKRNHLESGDTAFYAASNIILFVFFLLTLYPLVYLISASVSSPDALAQGRVVLFPIGFSTEGYSMVFQNKGILNGLYNSVIYTVVGTLINLALTLTTAFVLSRKELAGRGFFSFFFAFTMWFSGGMIPVYLLVNNLGIINTRWALWLTAALSVWNVIVTRTFITTTIPEELFEAASIDGCGYFRFFLSILLPLSKAIIAVMCLFYGIDHWNAFFRPLLYLTKEELYPLQMVLRKILVANEISADELMSSAAAQVNYGKVELLKYALIVVSCLPLWLAYPLIQKHFAKGVMIGSIKG